MKQKTFFIGITITILLMTSNTRSQTDKKMEMSTTAKNKAIVRGIFEEAFNKKKTALLKDWIDDAYVGPRGGKGQEGFLTPVQALLDAFPDIQWTIEELIGEGDIVMLRFTWKGTHNGQFTKYAATGKTVNSDGMGVYQFKNGKVISSTVSTDRLGFWQQIGVLPTDI